MAKTDPLKDKLVTIFGGSGFLGNYLTQSLLERGARIRLASRTPEKGWPLKPLANLGQLQLARCDVNDERAVAAAVAGTHAVVNLAGSFSGDLMQLMGEAPGAIAKHAKAAGAQALVHVSAIGADSESPTAYGRAKALGETRVLEAFPTATIVRPSVLFGKDDNFINMFAGLIQFAPVLPVFGPTAELQPAYVDDVAEAIAQSVLEPGRHGGKTFELGGPERMTMLELNARIAAAQGRKRYFIAMPDALSAIFAALPLTPMSSDQWKLLKAGNAALGNYPGFDELGIEPRPLGLFLDKWMVHFRTHGRFGLKDAGVTA
ncbi:complex I NDUFA9 subunit family protein [Altererythrobacter sp.]|uniref:complex I NDUFA9 subunit family protein n=1 Tax=Altererythrobacter sp. TaxID=1872480 RepID=UPI003D1406AB